MLKWIPTPRVRANVRHCRVSLEEKTRKKIARQHSVCGTAAKQTPCRCFSCKMEGWASPNLGFRSLSKLISVLVLRYCRRKCPRPDLFLQSRSLEKRNAHTRSRGQRRVDWVGCGNGCWFAVGSGRQSLPKYVKIYRTFLKQPPNASEVEA